MNFRHGTTTLLRDPCPPSDDAYFASSITRGLILVLYDVYQVTCIFYCIYTCILDILCHSSVMIKTVGVDRVGGEVGIRGVESGD